MKYSGEMLIPLFLRTSPRMITTGDQLNIVTNRRLRSLISSATHRRIRRRGRLADIEGRAGPWVDPSIANKGTQLPLLTPVETFGLLNNTININFKQMRANDGTGSRCLGPPARRVHPRGQPPGNLGYKGSKYRENARAELAHPPCL